MKCKISSVFCLLLTMASFAAPLRAADDFEALVFQDNKQNLPYRLCKPLGYDSQKHYPLVLFLHGAGERGTDNRVQLKHVVRIFATKENQEQYPCFVVAPQCPSNARWVEVNWGADRAFAAGRGSRAAIWPVCAQASKSRAEGRWL